MWFDVLAQPDQVNLLRLRDSSGSSLGYVYVETTGQLGFHDDATGTNTLSGTIPGPGWHSLELHLQVGATAGALGAVEDLARRRPGRRPQSTAPSTSARRRSGILQIGEVQTGLTYDVAFDDVAFGTSRLGPVADSAPPSTPSGVTAQATSAFATQVSWTASTDDVGLQSYEVFRDGVAVGTVPDTETAFTDTTVLASTTYDYKVRAWDLAGNVSPLSVGASVTTPAAAPPVFADGFESGGLAAWTSSAGLVAETSVVHGGSTAVEGSPTAGPAYAKKQLAATYTDAYGRVAFNVASQGTQVTLLRLRDTSTGSGAYVYLTAGGSLALRSDALDRRHRELDIARSGLAHRGAAPGREPGRGRTGFGRGVAGRRPGAGPVERRDRRRKLSRSACCRSATRPAAPGTWPSTTRPSAPAGSARPAT